MKLVSAFPRLAFDPLPAPPGFFALPLRLVVGYGFMAHGFAKLGCGPEVFIGILHAIGMPFAFLLGWATIVIELIGGALILCGALVPLASVPMIVVLLVAIVTVHLPNGFSSIKLLGYDSSGAHFGQPGYETDLLYLAALLALCFGGAGPFSVDGFVKPRLAQGQAKPRIRSGDDEGAFMSGPLIHGAKAGTVQKLDGPTGIAIGATISCRKSGTAIGSPHDQFLSTAGALRFWRRCAPAVRPPAKGEGPREIFFAENPA